MQHNDPTSRALSLVEIDRLFAVIPEEGPYRRFIEAMLYTGCRLGEIAGLVCSDIDLQDRTIRVSRTASPGFSGELVVGPTKGRRVRTVPLPEPLIPSVVRAMRGGGPHDILFPGPRGGTINSKNLSRALRWSQVRESVKTFPPGEPKLHWHDLRHTAATMMFRAGLSAPDVQAIMGHSNLTVTQIYARGGADSARRGAAALTNLYENRMGQPGPDIRRPDSASSE
ncbi:tyrosine-type recombinase/integrase [Herbiconiux flava]